MFNDINKKGYVLRWWNLELANMCVIEEENSNVNKIVKNTVNKFELHDDTRKLH